MFEKITYSFLLVFFFSLNAFSQREANIWYFGTYAGIDFNSGNAIPLTDGQINRWEGVASFCDSLGNLLIYTDGDSVWNANHQIMPNGYGLLGEPTSTESAIIVPTPNNDSIYFLFTVDAEGGDDGLCYSIINMNLDDSLGDVQEKNIQLETPVSEKVTAVRHSNNRDFWVITHGWETDSFFVYLVTPTGINTTPQIYEVGTPHKDIGITGNNAVGYMKASPNGQKLALVLQVTRIIELYDFNNTTGEISNPITIPDPGGSPYGVEFSPQSSKLYFTSRFYLYQADLSLPNPDDIINSVTLIDSSQTENFLGAVQVAPDGKIYMAHEYNNFLGVINNPELKGDSCNFILNGFYLKGRESRLGLPDFIQTYFLPPDFFVSNLCFGDSTSFFLSDTVGIDSLYWTFGDTLSANNSSKKFFPKHLFSAPGRYEVQLTVYENTNQYFKKRIIQINPLPQVQLGNDTLICQGDSILLNPNSVDCFYLWNNGTTDSTLWAFEDKTYSVTVTDIYTSCSKTDSLNLDLSALPDFDIGNDTNFCKNDSLFLSVNYPNAQFLWNTGSNDNFIYVSSPGTYYLQITDSIGCSASDSIDVEMFDLPQFDIGNDTILCHNTEINLSISGFEAYLWSDSSTFNNLNITEQGLYWLEVTDSNSCKSKDSIFITDTFPPDIFVGNDTVLCENDILTIELNNEDYLYVWNTGSSNSYLRINQPGAYWVKASNICGSDSDTIFVDFEYCGEIIIPNIFTPNNDGVNEFFKIKGIETLKWELYIYNRLGDLVFYSEDYKNNWNGDKNPDGVYYYVLQNFANKNFIFKGFVRIYRGEY